MRKLNYYFITLFKIFFRPKQVFFTTTALFLLLFISRAQAAVSCTGDGDCTPSVQYCEAGSCKNYCGPNNQRCSADKPLCYLGSCVVCTTDGECDPGMMCSSQNECVPIQRCSSTSDCSFSSTRICSQEGLCVNPPSPCTLDTHCQKGDVCNKTKGLCETPAKSCTADADCGKNQFCETPQNVCRIKYQERYVGGCAVTQYDGTNSLLRNFLALFLGILLVSVLYKVLRIRNRKSL